ncbi:hypothetical protein V5799_021761 [Amblyomma americanum]|uniref:Uncharacterized protein n=1 Tax=Amblyomma americanum TaxID=6943 RepID=A0AAQ4FMH8_AMBAM
MNTSENVCVIEWVEEHLLQPERETAAPLTGQPSRRGHRGHAYRSSRGEHGVCRQRSKKNRRACQLENSPTANDWLELLYLKRRYQRKGTLKTCIYEDEREIPPGRADRCCSVQFMNDKKEALSSRHAHPRPHGTQLSKSALGKETARFRDAPCKFNWRQCRSEVLQEMHHKQNSLQLI